MNTIDHAGPLKYRPELDGLRAVAILPVLFYHADLSWFPGGFVGVDVFFVLSGYFMATIISSEIAEGRFDIWKFYARRIRRIFPALFATLIATSIAAWFLFMPQEFEYFARSVRAAAVFIANLIFEREHGYFDLAAHMKPLLHTWSLSIEEQFYIFFPISLVLAYRYARPRVLAILLAVLGLSFIASCWAAYQQPTAGFYLLQYRVWELLTGAAVALMRPARLSAALANLMSWAGIAGIAAAVFLYDKTTPFPGIHAALPCVSAAMIVYSNARGGAVYAALSNPVATFIGRISYSLYLWHWPLIVFLRYRFGDLPSVVDSAIVVAGSFVLAYLSWRYIEQPFRYGRARLPRRFVFASGAAAAASIAIFGSIVTKLDGIPARLPEAARPLYEAAYDTSPFNAKECFISTDGEGPSIPDIRAGKLCAIGDTDRGGAPSFLVWGDSHSAAMAPAIDAAARKAGVRGLFIGRGSCPPLPDTDFAKDESEERCDDYNDAVMSVIERQKFPFVFMVGYWPRYVHRAGLPNEGAFFDANEKPPLEDWSAPVKAGLDATLAKLSRIGAKGVLVMDVPEMGFDVPEALARAHMTGRSLDIAPPLDYTVRRQALARRVLAQSARENGAYIVDPMPAICDDEKCHAMKDGIVLYKDIDHLTATGARSIAYVFDPVFRLIADGTGQRPGLPVQQSENAPALPFRPKTGG
ncbi:MAG: acyltransferase family protein [Shinella sp.]|nr:acyltransferase family protein [Shinella sp.]